MYIPGHKKTKVHGIRERKLKQREHDVRHTQPVNSEGRR